MAFIWTTPINVGDDILELAVSEIRDNTDYIDDNPTCLTFFGSIFVNDFTTYDTTYYTSNLSSNKTAQNSSNYFPECSYQIGAAP